MTTQDARELAAEVGRMLDGLLASVAEGELEADVAALAYLTGARTAAQLIAEEATPHRAAGRMLRAAHRLGGAAHGRG